MTTLLLLFAILTIIVLLTRWLMKKKNEHLIKSILNIEEENVEDFECGYGHENNYPI